ncbi:HD domain-containing protein [Kroppenstedtia eburnea]|uniref:HD domain-containing protein n=1 Tax=Kroppenstedtia eburnea TaxID=714067 RepID=UPI003627C1E1
MDQEIEKTIHYVKRELMGLDGSHDWFHVERVWRNSIRIGREEGGDMDVIQLAALLHDIADWKYHGGNEQAGPEKARSWLERLQADSTVIDHVCEIIQDLSFKGADLPSSMNTREGMIVQDADRLDAIGAVGIARAFAYGGYKKQELYNPEMRPKLHQSFEEYKQSQTTTVNHFYEKLLLLKERMNTATARAMAEERHEFMIHFLKTLQRECDLDLPAMDFES